MSLKSGPGIRAPKMSAGEGATFSPGEVYRDDVRDTPEIEGAMRALDERLEEIGVTIRDLEKRLLTVLRCENPGDDDVGGIGRATYRAPLAGRLGAYEERAQDILNFLHTMLDRVEL